MSDHYIPTLLLNISNTTMPPRSNHYNSSVPLEATESMYGKLTAILRYWLQYADDGKPVILSFGLGPDVVMNSIIGIPTLRQWGGSLDSISDEFSSCLLHTTFPIHYEPTK